MMASACVNKPTMPASPETFLNCPRISFSHDLAGDKDAAPSAKAVDKAEDLLDFEFCLGGNGPVPKMLPADELFSDGKLLPLQQAAGRAEIRSPEPARVRRKNDVSGSDPYLISSRAPRCTTRWRELLGLKSPKPEVQKPPAGISSRRSLNLQFLQRSCPSPDSSSQPLLGDSDPELVSISSRRSLSSSSSSSGTDIDEFPRLSLDSEGPNRRINPPRLRVAVPASRRPVRRDEGAVMRAAVESPRMNASGRVVFHGLERSSSSPGSFNGGRPPAQPRGMERSYSTNVMVLNVPVCSLRGPGKSVFGQLFSPQKKDRDAGVNGNSNGNGRVKMERSSARD